MTNRLRIKGEKAYQVVIKEIKSYLSSKFSENSDVSDEEKRRLLYISAKAGHKYDQFAYGCFCLYGYGGSTNIGHAEYWLNKAANAGNSDAQLTLGECYFDGHILDRDQEKGRYWLIIAATNGQENAKKYLEYYETISGD